MRKTILRKLACIGLLMAGAAVFSWGKGSFAESTAGFREDPGDPERNYR